MDKYIDIIVRSYSGYTEYLMNDILLRSTPSHYNFFWMLTIASAIFLLLEALKPWREGQALFRKDFWLDLFYMYFNFFLFSWIVFQAGANVVTEAFHDIQIAIGIDIIGIVNVSYWPVWLQLVVFFVLRDFIQWNIHRALHRYEWLWKFHKVHHSVEEMGFSAHLRYHWMENIVYATLQYLPLAMIGFNLEHAFWIYLVTTVIGHWNHTNFTLNIGFLRYIFNNPEMHIWHHAYNLPEGKRFGVNFGLSLSIWDYLFKTNYIPSSGRDIRLGFPNIESFPDGFIGQSLYGVIPQGHDSNSEENINSDTKPPSEKLS